MRARARTSEAAVFVCFVAVVRWLCCKEKEDQRELSTRWGYSLVCGARRQDVEGDGCDGGTGFGFDRNEIGAA